MVALACTAVKDGKRYVFAITDSLDGARSAHVDHARSRGGHETLHDAFTYDEHMTLSLTPLDGQDVQPPWGANVLFIDEIIEPDPLHVFLDTAGLRSITLDSQLEAKKLSVVETTIASLKEKFS